MAGQPQPVGQAKDEDASRLKGGPRKRAKSADSFKLRSLSPTLTEDNEDSLLLRRPRNRVYDDFGFLWRAGGGGMGGGGLIQACPSGTGEDTLPTGRASSELGNVGGSPLERQAGLADLSSMAA